MKSKWVKLGVATALLYLGFASICIFMEWHARARFHVPSKAEVEAVTERTARVRAEGARERALVEMREWAPYAVYDVAMIVLVVGGSVLSTSIGGWVVWRTIRPTRLKHGRWIVLGTALVVLPVLALLAAPSLATTAIYESSATSFLDGR